MMETTSAYIWKEYIKPNIGRFIINNTVDLLLIDRDIFRNQIIPSLEIFFKLSSSTCQME